MSHPLIDPQVFGELQANTGDDFVVELVQTFADEAPLMLAELRDAYAAGSAGAFRRAAHSLKSNSNTFGACRLAELARSLELGGRPGSAEPIEALARELARSIEALRALAQGQPGG